MLSVLDIFNVFACVVCSGVYEEYEKRRRTTHRLQHDEKFCNLAGCQTSYGCSNCVSMNAGSDALPSNVSEREE
jgi:hypothetical protein